MRTNFDLTPYRRATVGFDRLFDRLESDLHEDAADGYPAFDVAQLGDDRYRITLAVTGFRPDQIEVVAQPNQLVITGKPTEEPETVKYLHRGLVTRPFERRFQLADYVEVGSAQIENGLLIIDLRRIVPEALKPRRIAIETPSDDASDARRIETQSTTRAA